MEVFPFVFYHPLEPTDPCFKDTYEGSSSDFVENAGDNPFQALPAMDVVFGEFLLDRPKEEEATWREVRAPSRVRCPLDLFPVTHSMDCLALWTTVSQKNAKLYVRPFRTSTRLWIPLTDQKNEIK
jgi:hypothetical protein